MTCRRSVHRLGSCHAERVSEQRIATVEYYGKTLKPQTIKRERRLARLWPHPSGPARRADLGEHGRGVAGDAAEVLLISRAGSLAPRPSKSPQRTSAGEHDLGAAAPCGRGGFFGLPAAGRRLWRTWPDIFGLRQQLRQRLGRRRVADLLQRQSYSTVMRERCVSIECFQLRQNDGQPARGRPFGPAP